ncbi:hypothetical protein [Streptomyces sp. NPDC014623]|uniref:hypothetical protein n=1 Tax=Streptomyces sp. NPDC014623 TaxID=3364875 RepID=UPI003701B816
MTELSRQTNDKVVITVYDTIARCRPRVTGELVEKMVGDLGFLPKDAKPADVGRRVRELLDTPEEKADAEEKGDGVPDISSLGGLPKMGSRGGSPAIATTTPRGEGH